MRIAQISPLTEAVPPAGYGGTERVVSWLSDELVALGHDVTLYASGDSRTSAALHPVWPRALRYDTAVRDPYALHILMLEQVRRAASDFDVLHFHLDYFPFSLFARQMTPFINTLHGRLDLPEHRPLFAAFPSVPLVSISNSQRKPLSGLGNRFRTIYHGVPSTLLRPRDLTPRYLAFLGRISPEKGIEEAIHIAGRAGMPLKIAAKIDKADEEFFAHRIKPLLKLPHVEYIGEITDEEKSGFLSEAVGLLNPIQWQEPFGLVMIEAMACGTPVIAMNRGSVLEIVEHELTGFVIDTAADAVSAIGKLPMLSRARVRERFEQRFTARRMAEDYVDAYDELIGTHQASK